MMSDDYNPKLHAPMNSRMNDYRDGIHATPTLQIEGKLTRMVGLTMEANGFAAPMGSRCLVSKTNGDVVTAEVIGFNQDTTYLLPLTEPRDIVPGARIVATGKHLEVSVSPDLLGRVIDGCGNPLDTLGPIEYVARVPLYGHRLNPFARAPINKKLDVGVRAINALFPVGCGSRIGVYGATGVGKTALLGMMARYADADVIVVGLVGCRGNAVKEFVEQHLTLEGLRRACVVTTSADDTPLARFHSALRAMSIAEYYRDRGANVLLLLDSLTQFAQAGRELALAVGETAHDADMPLSVFAKCAQLIERAGNAAVGEGSITTMLSIHTEEQTTLNSIAPYTHALLDGQIILTRELAAAGHFPAIDIEHSHNRLMPHFVQQQHLECVHKFKNIHAQHRPRFNLMNLDYCVPGKEVDMHSEKQIYSRLAAFLQQDIHQQANSVHSLVVLEKLLSELSVTA